MRLLCNFYYVNALRENVELENTWFDLDLIQMLRALNNIPTRKKKKKKVNLQDRVREGIVALSLE